MINGFLIRKAYIPFGFESLLSKARDGYNPGSTGGEFGACLDLRNLLFFPR